MGQRTEALADKLEAAVADFAKTIEMMPEAKWTADCDGGWTVGQVAEHVAGQFPLEMEFITAAAEGRPLPDYSLDDINAKNDGRAAKNKSMTKEQVLATLNRESASVAAYIRQMSDEQLDRKNALPMAKGVELTTQQVLEGGILIDHVRGHLQSIQAVL